MDLFNLQHKVEQLIDQFDSPDDPELLKLLQENHKLKYRLQHLERNVANEQVELLKNLHNIDSPIALIKTAFAIAIKKAFPQITDHTPIVDVHKDENKWDYFCNSGFSIGKSLKQNPKQASSQLVEFLPQEFTNLLDQIEVAGPGFINLRFKTKFYAEKSIKVIKNRLGVNVAGRKKRLVIDYSAPNIAKDMHVGHLRSTIIGDAIANLFEYLNYELVRLNHIGDWGTQFGMLIAHLQDEFPDYATKTPSIKDLEAFYKASKKRFDDAEEKEFKDRAYQNVVKLQAYDAEITGAWKAICQASRENYSKIYQQLNISPNLIERGESFYNELMRSMVDDLKKNGKLTEDEGRFIYFPKQASIPLTVIKSDGGFTYDTSDLACIKQRIDNENADAIFYVTDAGQATHFEIVMKAAQEMGWYNPDKIRIEHVPFGVVLGKDKKKFKTRSGETVKLMSLLDEGKERVRATMQKAIDEGKNDNLVGISEAEFDQIANNIAISSVKYADLASNREKAYVFDFDRMLDFQGNTGAYLLYAYTRIKSVARKCQYTSEKIRSDKFIDRLENTKKWDDAYLAQPEERKLAKKIIMWYWGVD